MKQETLDSVLAPLDWMRVRVVGTPECANQAAWVGFTGEVVAVNKALPHWAHVRIDHQKTLRLFETKHLRIIGESPTRQLMLTTGGYTASSGPISPTAPQLEF